MLTHIRPALVLLACFTVLTGVIYPVLVTGLARSIFPHQAGGSLVGGANGELVGSELLGQTFAEARYFAGRPSATGPAPYNGAASGATNQGPLNPALHTAVTERIAALRAANPEMKGEIPADLATASGSGLDPHISPEAARFQAPRVAAARGWTTERVLVRVEMHVEPRTFGILGEPRVNVLRLNQDLDAQR
ncbi:potassium-transporting ATPase subunit KdpC [Nannocystis sp.]|uniref:potassium-transporting ATPase subunit KdpC n=1 Tax=Nannocystis sp. TaxID=1962667 RepID=UPI0025F3EB7B|nr:potassium-transporting ATPase subunit KdpC [Nannocystis sp.]MBK7828560.1 potassium-transporting ATPase subunit KdpC [Nannocystis sp.]